MVITDARLSFGTVFNLVLKAALAWLLLSLIVGALYLLTVAVVNHAAG